MARFLILLTLLLVAGCADPPQVPWDDTLTLDASMPPEKLSGAVRAVDAWRERTGGAAALGVRIADVSGGMRTVTETDLPDRILGSCNVTRIYLDDRDMAEDLAYRVTMHEIGHYLGLEHVETSGHTMSPNVCRTCDTVDDLAVAAFFDLYLRYY